MLKRYRLTPNFQIRDIPVVNEKAAFHHLGANKKASVN
jgi:hypothetical protein